MTSTVTDLPVLVTGATGFVAGHVIQQLLLKGYRVRTTVRDIKKKDRYAYLMELEGSDRIEFFQADLNDKDSFRPCFEGGIEFVQHIASPYALTVSDPQRDLVDPAVNGTVSVLELCMEHTSVKKVVITSSIASVTDCPDSDKLYTEEDWNTQSSLTRNPYYFSKVEAEKAANVFMEKNQPSFALAFILPGAVIGPSLGTALNESHNILLQFLTGEVPVVLDLTYSFSDVRDIASAHIVAMENSAAIGRFLCTIEPHHMVECLDKIKVTFPELAAKIPSRQPPSWIIKSYTRLLKDKGTADFVEYNIGRIPRFSNEKAVAIGVPFRPWQDSVRDTVDFFKRINAVVAPWVHEKVCALCAKSYSLMLCEHHCRLCRRSVCNDCSSGRKLLQWIGGKMSEERVCATCT